MSGREPWFAASAEPLPENLTRCSDCGAEFSEPATNWDDFFQSVEDASFWCASCEAANSQPQADK